MALPGTIGLVQADGLTAHVWTTTAVGNAGPTHKELLVRALGEHKLSKSGVYIVATINQAGMPYASVFTVNQTPQGTWTVEGGLPHSGRVNRWPPKPAKA